MDLRRLIVPVLFGAVGAVIVTVVISMPGRAPTSDRPHGPPPKTITETKKFTRFEVRLAKDLLPKPTDGRLLIIFAEKGNEEPWHNLEQLGLNADPMLGVDVNGLKHGQVITVDNSATAFPQASLSAFPKTEYSVQAVFDYNRDLKYYGAPGNLVSEPKAVNFDPTKDEVIQLELTKKLPADEPPADTEDIKYLKFRSEKLSDFHGRPIYLRAGVILPRDHAKNPDKRYPLRVHIGGYGSRYTQVQSMMAEFSTFREHWADAKSTPMILLHLDGAGPLGDPYQINSANHGPYGDAVTQELIPHVEKLYRGIGKPHARVLDGASTGGWVSLALQIFYPDFFNGAWSHCPDPVDFRCFELINIYKDQNAYINEHGFDRPANRTLLGDIRYTMRHELQHEMLLARGNKWTISGKDWAAWNAAFSPRGKDGLPVPLWNGATGKIDRKVAEHWKKYDLRHVLETNWKTLGPKVADKLHIWVGEADEYFLNNAVHKLDDFLQRAEPAFKGKITFQSGKGHNWRGISEAEMVKEMAEAIRKGR